MTRYQGTKQKKKYFIWKIHQCIRNTHLSIEGLTILLWWTPLILLLGRICTFLVLKYWEKKNYCIFSVYDQQTPSPTQSPQTIPRDHGSYSFRWEILHRCRGARWKKNVWKFAHGDGRIVNRDKSPDPHSWRSQSKKNPLFSVVQKYNRVYATNNAWIDDKTLISHHCIAFFFRFKFGLTFRVQLIFLIFDNHHAISFNHRVNLMACVYFLCFVNNFNSRSVFKYSKCLYVLKLKIHNASSKAYLFYKDVC